MSNSRGRSTLSNTDNGIIMSLATPSLSFIEIVIMKMITKYSLNMSDFFCFLGKKKV